MKNEWDNEYQNRGAMTDDLIRIREELSMQYNTLEHINIEIQLKDEYNMIKRSLYYWSKLYEGQLENGENYQKLSRTICINLLDFNLLNHDKFHSAYRLKDCETNEELTDVMELHFIELKKMKDVKRVEEVKTTEKKSSVRKRGISNNNQMILDLYAKGKSNIEIAKELGLGIGEVRLVIDLFNSR